MCAVLCRNTTPTYTNEKIEPEVSIFQEAPIILEISVKILSSVYASQGYKYAGEIYHILYPIMSAGYESHPIIKMHKCIYVILKYH